MDKNSFYNIMLCLFLGGAMTFIMGCPPAMAMQANNGSNITEDHSNSNYKSKFPAMPPIDAVAPSNFETASFGLG